MEGFTGADREFEREKIKVDCCDGRLKIDEFLLRMLVDYRWTGNSIEEDGVWTAKAFFRIAKAFE